MINSSGGVTQNQSTSTTTTTGNTPTFPTHNPAMQHQQFMNGSASTVTTTTTTPNPTGAMPPAPPKFPDPTKNLIKVTSDGSEIVSASGTGNTDSTQPKKKMNLKMIIGVIILFFVLLGSGVGFYLSQQTQDLRQQAKVGEACSTHLDCDNNRTTPGIKEYCVNRVCTTTAPPHCGDNLNCDPGIQVGGGTACLLGPNDNLVPTYCCPTGYVIADPEQTNNYHCVQEVHMCPDNSGPAVWCATFDCNVSGDVNGDGQCTSADGVQAQIREDANCPTPTKRCGQIDFYRSGIAGQNWDAFCGAPFHHMDECPTGGGGGTPTPTPYAPQCNSDCEIAGNGADICTNTLGSAYSCIANKCRLTANPTSITCQPATSGTNKTISGKAYCELEPPTSPLYAINNVPIKIYDSAANNIGNETTAGAGTYSSAFGLDLGNAFAVRVGGGAGTATNPAFRGAGATLCNPQHENCPFTSMPTTQPNMDFKTNVVPTTLANTCSADGHATITWNKATNYDGTKVTNYILRLDYDETQDGAAANTWKPDTIANGGNPHDYWRYAPVTVGTCTATTCTVDTHIFNQETGAYAKSWKTGKYFVNVNPVANSTLPGAGATVIELCRATQTFTCTTTTTYQCGSACTTNTQCQGSLGAAYSCVTNKCRLTANPTSATCTPTYACNSTCTTDAQCQGALGGAYSCYKKSTNLLADSIGGKSSGNCRLTANPTSATCAAAPIVCNSVCSPTTEKTDSLLPSDDICTKQNPLWSCDPTSSRCRLTANPTSVSCDAAPLVCNSSCDPNAKTDLCTAANDKWYCDPTAKACRFKTNPTSTSCQPPVGTVACNQACTSNTQCTSTNANYTCDSTSKTCRLISNPTSTTCEPVPPKCNEACSTNAECEKGDPDHYCDATTKTCRLKTNPSSTTCSDPVATPTPTPAPGCNNTCVTNADCSNTNHICATTEDGTLKCRLSNYTSSNTCTLPTTSTAQPTLPPALPQTGPEDWMNWLKAGLVTLGLGAALFLLL